MVDEALRPVRDMVADEAVRLGLSLSPSVLEQLTLYLQLLERWGARLNLTARAEPRQVVARQLADGLLLGATLGAYPAVKRMVDAGAGAGLVGLPAAIVCPGIELALIEATQRKCAFLREAVHQLQLPGRVYQGRLEQLEVPTQDLALSRATWAPSEWVQLGAHLVGEGGLLACFLAREKPPAHPGWALEVLRAYQLDDGTPRQLLLLRRNGGAGQGLAMETRPE